MGHPVHLQTVAFQGTSLSERLLTEVTLVGPNSCMCSCVSLQVECVIEAFAAEGTEVALDIAVAFHVSVEKALQAESLLADLALELAVLLGLDGLHLVGLRPGRQVHGQRVLDPMTTVDQFQRGVNGNSEPLLYDLDAHLKAGDVADIVLLVS